MSIGVSELYERSLYTTSRCLGREFETVDGAGTVFLRGLMMGIFSDGCRLTACDAVGVAALVFVDDLL